METRLMGAGAFNEKTDLHTRGALFLWDVLQCHRVMAEYVDMNFVNHPEIWAFIVSTSLYESTYGASPQVE
jgi:hypothetical protein